MMRKLSRGSDWFPKQAWPSLLATTHLGELRLRNIEIAGDGAIMKEDIDFLSVLNSHLFSLNSALRLGFTDRSHNYSAKLNFKSLDEQIR